MKGSWRSFAIIGLVFLIALVFYIFTTPHGKEIPLTGMVDGNEVIVGPQIMGRIINLTVDEGFKVKKGDLIAELDPRNCKRASPRRRPTSQVCRRKSTKQTIITR